MARMVSSRIRATTPGAVAGAASHADDVDTPMELSRQPLRHRVSIRRALVLAALLTLAGCAQGDFEEIHPSLVRDDIHDWIGRDTKPGQPSTFQYTDDERLLRDLAYPLIEPPYDRKRWYSVAGEYGMLESARAGSFNAGDYASHLMSEKFRSPSARYSQLIDDIRNDSTRMPAFFETAGRVLDMDRKRQKSLGYVQPNPGEHRNAMRRIEENKAVVGMVYTRLAQRIDSYRFALERMVIETPSQQAVEAEQALNRLTAQLALYRTMLPPTWMRGPSLAANN